MMQLDRNFLIATMVALCVPAIAQAGSRSDWLIGPYIAPSSPIDVLDGTIDFKASPSASAGELNDAIGMFADRGDAVRRLDQFRQGGRVYAGFEYDNKGRLQVVCGRTSTWSTDWEEIEEHNGEIGRDWNSEVSFGTFDNFKRAGRDERVFAMAECLSHLPEMPPLKPVHPRPEAIHIERDVYADALAWLSAGDAPAIRGSREQYETVFRCLVTASAKTLRGVGGKIAVRRFDSETGGGTVPYSTAGRDAFGHETITMNLSGDAGKEIPLVRHRSYMLSAVSTGAGLDRIFDADDSEETGGIWPSRGGFVGVTFDGVENPFEQMLGQTLVRENMDGCRRTAGLFVMPPARIEPGPVALGCQ